jgi:hypothetical protein
MKTDKVIRAEHEKLYDWMIGSSLGDELSCSKVMQVYRVTTLFNTKRKNKLSKKSEMNQPVFVKSFYSLQS